MRLSANEQANEFLRLLGLVAEEGDHLRRDINDDGDEEIHGRDCSDESWQEQGGHMVAAFTTDHGEEVDASSDEAPFMTPDFEADKAIGCAPVPPRPRDGFGADVGLVPGTQEHFLSAMANTSAAPKPNLAPPTPTPRVAEIAKPHLAMLKMAFISGDQSIAETAVLGLAQKLATAEARLQAIKEMLE